MSENITFKNKAGDELSARLDLPPDQKPKGTALFAHCFTCNKNFNAVRHVSRALIEKGIAVLRFDFTGLGESEGEFSDSTFSMNVQDLLSACDYLEDRGLSPDILIGHSLGGAAVVFAAEQMDKVQAVVTIGAPSGPDHIRHLFEEDLEKIKSEGEAKVNIGGRPFKIKKEFVDDLRNKNMKAILNKLEIPLLIFHSPVDQIVDVENAAEIYKAARHPKSYISLDDADHLLSKKEDSLYVGEVISSWLVRYLPQKMQKEPFPHIPEKGVVAHLGNEGYTTTIHDGRHRFIADEPKSVGGEDLGPSPYELLSAALGSCSVMTLQMYARRKKWDLKEVIVEVEHFKDHAHDCDHCEDKEEKIDHLHKHFTFMGDLDDDQKKRLLEIAEKCPVNKTLQGVKHIQSTIKGSSES
ncbi:MAG: bifunctional alpha/beta hydrolase/OsmC family protein [Saprospiraceae bacterium]|nr:bifunctional alpha/beta hydrolase/OsmC family protein [Saprospiraceae bacterium]